MYIMESDPHFVGLVDPLGFNASPTLDGLPYTSLLYGNGPGYTSPRQDLTAIDTGKSLHLLSFSLSFTISLSLHITFLTCHIL